MGRSGRILNRIPGYHDRRWQDGPPEDWEQEHDEAFEATVMNPRAR